MDAAIGGSRNKLILGNHIHSIEMRGQKEALFDFAWRRKGRQQIGPARQNLLKTNIQARPGRRDGNEISHPSFPGAGIVGGAEGRVDARQGDQLAQQFFGIRHLSGEFRG